jgi:hypothetical protein
MRRILAYLAANKRFLDGTFFCLSVFWNKKAFSWSTFGNRGNLSHLVEILEVRVGTSSGSAYSKHLIDTYGESGTVLRNLYHLSLRVPPSSAPRLATR